MRVDPELNAFVGSIFSEKADLNDAPDPFRKFIESAELAGVIGWRHVARFEEETQELDQRANEALQKTRTAKTESWDEELTDDSRLAKRYSADLGKGRNTARIEKSANGQWVFEYDAEGNLLRGYADEAA